MQCQSVYQREVWCVSECGGLQISNQDQRVCQEYMSGHGYNYVKSVAMSQYLFQGDESGVGMSEGVTSWMLC